MPEFVKSAVVSVGAVLSATTSWVMAAEGPSAETVVGGGLGAFALIGITLKLVFDFRSHSRIEDEWKEITNAQRQRANAAEAQLSDARETISELRAELVRVRREQ